MFYSSVKRHTGGWCGPGQRIAPSVVCQPATSLAGSADRLPAVLAPAPALVDQGPGARRVVSHQQPAVSNNPSVPSSSSSVFRGRPRRRNPSAFRNEIERAPVFQHPRASPWRSAGSRDLRSGAGGSQKTPSLPLLGEKGVGRKVRVETQRLGPLRVDGNPMPRPDPSPFAGSDPAPVASSLPSSHTTSADTPPRTHQRLCPTAPPRHNPAAAYRRIPCSSVRSP